MIRENNSPANQAELYVHIRYDGSGSEHHFLGK